MKFSFVVVLVVILSALAVARAAEAPFSLGPDSLPAPTSQQAPPPPVNVAAGIVEYMVPRFSAHEPMYFLYWPDSPDIKFQISLKYQLLGSTNPLLKFAPNGSSLHLAYTQTTLWNISGKSSPVYDTSYKPELLYLYEQSHPTWLPGLSHFDLQASVQHESNGRDGDVSRSLNLFYVRPIFTFGDPGNHPNPKNDLFITVAPRAWVYLGNKEEPTMQDYRGYGDLKIIVGERGGIQLAWTGRIGEGLGHGAMEFDVSCPLSRVGLKNPDLYLYGQYFIGSGETLRDFDIQGSSIRVGLALVR